MSNITWLWDVSRGKYYWYSTIETCYVYEDGQRISADNAATSFTTQAIADASSPEYVALPSIAQAILLTDKAGITTSRAVLLQRISSPGPQPLLTIAPSAAVTAALHSAMDPIQAQSKMSRTVCDGGNGDERFINASSHRVFQGSNMHLPV